MKPLGTYGWAYGLFIFKDHDKLKTNFKNLKKNLGVKWTGSTVKVQLSSMETKENFFESDISLRYGSSTKKFHTDYFQCRYPSEHSVDGKKADFEMQVIHKSADY